LLNLYKFSIFIFFILILSDFLHCQDKDSLSFNDPRKAVIRAFMFPGGGQFYNEQKIKGSILLSGAVLSSLVHLDYANKYKNHDGENFSQKEQYLKQRNRYAWWVLIIYFYGLVDALVESHLNPFEKVMSEDIEKSKNDEKEIKK